MSGFGIRGVVVDRTHFTPGETVALIDRLGRLQATHFTWPCLAWQDAHRPVGDDVWTGFLAVRNACAGAGLTLWIGLKPGDHRWCFHRSDRKRFLDNARRFLDAGVGAVYLLMDDMHGGNLPNVQNDEPRLHAQLIAELAEVAGDRFPAICAQQYAGRKLEPAEYWEPILQALPARTAITWTGPQIRSWRLDSRSFPDVAHPVLLWDNSLVMYSDGLPPGPYPKRRPELTERLAGVLVNVGRPFAAQLASIRTAMRCLAEPAVYTPLLEFETAILELAKEGLRTRVSDERALREAARIVAGWLPPA